MNPTRLVAVSLALFLASPLLPAPPVDTDVLASLRNSWTVAVRQGEADKIAALFSEDATVMPPGFPSFTGRKAIEGFYRDGFAVATISEFQAHPKERRVGANSERERGTYRITWVPKDNSAPYTLAGRYMLFATQRSDGKWEIIWEMHTIETKVPLDQLKFSSPVRLPLRQTILCAGLCLSPSCPDTSVPCCETASAIRLD